MFEAFKPIAVRPPSENQWLFLARCLVDLQLLTISRFLVAPLSACRGKVLSVGAGETSWHGLLPEGTEYVGLHPELQHQPAIRQQGNADYCDSKRLPYEDGSFDHVFCTEVLEHAANPAAFLAELKRVIRQGGTLVLTVPWSAGMHHLPCDYYRYSRFGLIELFNAAGFSYVAITERGSDISAIANKLVVLLMRMLRPKQKQDYLWTLGVAALVFPLAVVFLAVAHVSLLLETGSKEDPLGYGVIAVK